MPLYLFVWNMFAWTITAAVLWPLMFPWLKLAYKIWHGNKEIEEELADELWVRSGLGSAAMTVFAIVFLLADYATVEWLELPSGPVHVVNYVGFLAMAGGIMYYFFYMEDFFSGLNLAVIYLYIPTTLLFGLWFLIQGFFSYGLFSYVQSWLKDPSAP